MVQTHSITGKVPTMKYQRMSVVAVALAMLVLGGCRSVIGLGGRIDEAKWTEGKAGAGTILTSIKVYAATYGPEGTYGKNLPVLKDMGMSPSDLDGMYFDSTNYSWMTGYDAETKTLMFIIDITRPAGIASGPSVIMLDQDGNWAE
jgi:hypothetical protein